MSGCHARLGLGLVMSALACTAQDSAAQSWRTQTIARGLHGEERLEVEVEFTAGRFRLEPARNAELFRAELVYDEERFTSEADYDVDDRVLRLDLTASGDLDDFDFDEDSRQRLDLAVAPAVPARLNLEIGAARAEIELGSLSLAGASIATGASESRVRFGRPNRIACEGLTLEMGAAELRVEGLGNARCREIVVGGGVGHLLLDFTGAWRPGGLTEGDIELGLGALTLRFPEDLGVEIEMDRLLVGFDAPGFTQRGDRYVSTGFDAAPAKLYLNIDAALGTIEVEWVGK